MDKIESLKITVQKARDGRDYVQIMSGDAASVNVVLIADHIEISDVRPPPPTN